MPIPKKIARRILPLAVLLAGCSVPPKPDTPPMRDAAPLAGVPSDTSRTWPDPEWWKHYGDEQLDALEDQGTRKRADARRRERALRHRRRSDRHRARRIRRQPRWQRRIPAPAPQRNRPDPADVPRFHLVQPGRSWRAVPLRLRFLGQAARRDRSRSRRSARRRSRGSAAALMLTTAVAECVFQLAGRPGARRADGSS